MPELPEVEVILGQLRPNLLGSHIRDFQIRRSDIIRVGGSGWAWYVGSQISDISRKGKSLLFTCIKEKIAKYMVAELGMTGLFLFEDSALDGLKHLHITLMFDQSHLPHLHYWNPRRFGRVYLLGQTQLDQFLRRRFGVDPLAMTEDDFCFLIGQTRGRLKSFLLDQHHIAGIGNIYANEILYRAGIHPHARGNRLSKAALRRLYRATQTVLTEAIARGGSTIRDFRAPNGASGRFQEHHAVYHKAGHFCPRGCQVKIQRLMTARSTFYCPRCQKRT